MIIAYEALGVTTNENKLIRLLGQENCCDWKRVEWYPGCSWHAAKGHTFRPLYQGSNMALANACSG